MDELPSIWLGFILAEGDAATSASATATAIKLVSVIVLVAANGFFVAAEFALVGLRASRIETLAAAGNRSAKRLLTLLQNLNAYLSACQLGITLASLALGWIGEPAIARLLDLGLEPFLVTATLEGVVAQRLVRRICLNCKAEYTPGPEQLMELELRADDVAGRKFWYGKGCEQCNNTGYRGRQGIYEFMLLDDEMRDMIIKHASTQLLRAESKKRGMRTLRHSGLMAIYDGVTTIEEVVRETIMEEG